MIDQAYDVVAVSLSTLTVHILNEGETERDAEAIAEMAIMRRGAGEEFFSKALAGKYRDGDQWNGQ